MSYISLPDAPPQPAQIPKDPLPDKQRYSSIDAIKGFAILALWLVNATLSDKPIPSQLKPGIWGHPTFADCIFPALIFGVGAGIPLSAAFRVRRETMAKFMLGAASKAFWLILFGVLVESAIARRPVANCGPLQLVGVAYVINAVFGRTPIVLRVFLAEGILLTFYVWAKMNTVPGAQIGTFTEAQNIIRLVNEKSLAPYGLGGLLALIPVTSIMMSGSVIGSCYLLDDSRVRRGLIFVGVGATLTFFGWLWALDQPMVASLWTSSYALFTTGIAVAVLGVFSILFDSEIGYSIGYPLKIPASAIILSIVGPVLLKTMILDVWRWPGSDETIGAALRHLISTVPNPNLSSWIYPIAMILIWWSILAIVYHGRKWLRMKCPES
jgi:predicted acyltransferase